MTEENKPEEKTPEEKPEEKKEEPVAPAAAAQPVDLIGDANLAAKRLEDANKELGVLLARQEALRVEETLGGKTDVGVPKKKVSDEEYAKKVLAGEIPK